MPTGLAGAGAEVGDGRYFEHTVNGQVYTSIGLEPRPRTLGEYKVRIRQAYGSLRGVTNVREVKPGHCSECGISEAHPLGRLKGGRCEGCGWPEGKVTA